MNTLSQRLLHRYYRDRVHPYKTFEQRVEQLLAHAPASVLLDAGCGRTVPVLRKFIGRARRLIGNSPTSTR